jgi:hypothetical protein
VVISNGSGVCNYEASLSFLRRPVLHRQTGRPLDHKTLRKHFAHEIAIGAAEVHARIGKFMLAASRHSEP